MIKTENNEQKKKDLEDGKVDLQGETQELQKIQLEMDKEDLQSKLKFKEEMIC